MQYMEVGNEWFDLVYYDETSPSCLRWKVEVRRGRGHGAVFKKPGDVAGAFNKFFRYWIVSQRVNGRRILFRAHRIVMKLHGYEVPTDKEVDHIDRDRTNNKIQNLRIASRAVNCKNQGPRSTNNTGRKGIFFHFDKRCGITSVAVKWSGIDEVQKVKYFSTYKLGLLPAFRDACIFADSVQTEENGYTILKPNPVANPSN